MPPEGGTTYLTGDGLSGGEDGNTLCRLSDVSGKALAPVFKNWDGVCWLFG
jgi:hypothetical protein